MKKALVLAIFFQPLFCVADVTLDTVKDGQWAVSLIVNDREPGETSESFTTAAMRQRLADVVEAYYPPMNDTMTGYVVSYALVRLVGNVGTPDSDTYLLPDINLRLNQLSAQQRNNLRNNMRSRFPAYVFTDYNGSVQNKNDYSVFFDSLSSTSTIKEVIQFSFNYLAHSNFRPRVVVAESHNTEYTDNFDSDPYAAPARWTVEIGSAAYDSSNGELDFDNTAEHLTRYSTVGPGSIEHEMQSTMKLNLSNTRTGCAATRMQDSASPDDGYAYWIEGTVFNVVRYNAGSRTSLTVAGSETGGTGDFYTCRLASTGTAGSNVTLTMWAYDHGTTKPSDPGWYGTDESPELTYTDTAATRLDDSTHDRCGIAGRGRNTESQYDTQHDFFKQRAISDRGGVAATPPPMIRRIIISQ